MRSTVLTRIVILSALCCLSLGRDALAIGQAQYVENAGRSGSFPIVQADAAATICVDAKDWPGVIRAANDLQADIARVTNRKAAISNDAAGLKGSAIIIGTIGKSKLIDDLVKAGKIDTSQITGKWESFFLQVVPNALPNVANALVIVGSDKRGTIYGIYDLSEQMGVSPWYWWADVPVQHKDALFVKAGKYQQGEPSVKYRGIFLNDESPDLSGWVAEKFGRVPVGTNPPVPSGVANYNSQFYTKLFELILRVKGNYLWPAMWNNAFNEDDPNNPRLADEYGVVMGTSHQEPMLRAQKEWDRRYQRTLGSWNYYRDPNVLEQFWREGIRRNKDYESILTIGLRGANDTPMIPNGTVAQSMELLEKIVAVQRKMIGEEMNPNVTKVPQLWCLYKEVQEYYEKGLRVPDDVTLLWAEDNWGDVRRLPTAEERKRPGGAGVYYHFDYVGGPRNYKWINTNPIPKICDQLTLAKEYGADRIWIVNVGHFKGLEFPIEYFMNLGWNTKRWTIRNTDEFTRLWAAREFGSTYADAIADLITKYTKYNGRRKPELLDPSIYNLTSYQEADTVVADFKAIAAKAEEIQGKLPESARDAFYELVLFPAKACSQVTELYVAAGKNALYAQQGRAAANDMADQVEALFKADADLMAYYNKTFAGGKWDHFMDQVHIGYTSWQDPQRNVMPRVRRIELPQAAAMGVAVEGSTLAWPGASGDPCLPRFDALNRQRYYVDVFNHGTTSFDYAATASEPWIVPSVAKGTVAKEERIWVSVDWAKAPKGSASGTVKLERAGGESVTVKVAALNPKEITRGSLDGFAEGDGYVSIEAEHYMKNIPAGNVRWEKVDNYGRTLSAMTIQPVTAASVTPPKDSPCLEYKVYLFDPNKVKVLAIVAPTLNFVPDRALRYAVSFDNQPPQVVEIVRKGFDAQNGNRDWEESVKNACRVVQSAHTVSEPGYHTLKIWMVDPAVVLQKIIIDLGGLKPNYLGPPESYRGAPPEGTGAFATGRYRNLFVEAGHPQDEVIAKVNAAYQQLFHGDPNTQTLYYPTGSNANGPMAYLPDIAHRDVRSEGMSYGMMIAVQLNKKAEFDALWNWSMTHMYHAEPNHPTYGFFSWQMNYDGTVIDELPAPDGEAYYAMALYFAANRWGNGKGIYDYKAQADRLLTNMVHREPITGMVKQRRGATQWTVGKEVNDEHAMILFSPDSRRNNMTDPSYHLPHFYELWSRWGPPQDRAFWAKAAEASRDFFQQTANFKTGLAPNYANFDGTPYGSGNRSDAFRYDAWRTASNWSVDWSWWGKDAGERELSDRIQTFFESQGIEKYVDQFALDGAPLGQTHSTGLVSTNGVASLAATDAARAKKFVEALWNADVPSGQQRYYDGTLYMMSLLHASGQFRIWAPQKPDALEVGFASPPDSARPQNWWHWMNGNVSKEGITLDLEAMKRVGIGGFHLFQVGANIPQGAVKFGSPENTELLKFAAKEADRLGLEFAMHDCPGWSSSGGPWITPELSMKVLTTSETPAAGDGSNKIEVDLPQPASQRNFYRDALVLAFPTPSTEAQIANFRVKAGFPGARGARGAGVTAPAVSGVDPASVRDISKNMDAQGHLSWDAPAGNWTILRIGYTTTGAQNSPGPTGGEGLECDKFDRAAIEFHFNHYLGDLFDSIKPLAAKGRAGILIDSYERGLQNWSANFPQEFQKRRGYDLKPYLPAMTGRVVGNTDISERFLWDVRKTQAELMEEYYYGRFAELCHARGMKAFIEPYDPGNFDEMAAGAYADMPMGEFWQDSANHHSIKLAASVAHVNGRPIMAAESFTSSQKPWGEYPYSLKALGDFMFTQGLNRIILHSFAMQPHPTAAPGVTMGRWGGFFERTNTWYPQASVWLQYLARCQFMLQQGSFSADLLYFAGQDSPARAPDASALNPAGPPGYAFDTIDPGAIIKRAKIQDGRIVLPDGMTYRVFVLPSRPAITVDVLRKIHDLVNDGMCLVVAGPKPESTPSLSGYPDADKEVRRLAGELWGDLNGTTTTEGTFGKGQVFWGQPLADVLGKLGVKPDFEVSSRFSDATVNYIHRRIGGTDAYFVANRKYRSEDLVCTFRVDGKLPEFWSPDTGRIVPAAVYDLVDGRVRVPIHLDPAGSVFVIFRSSAPARRLQAIVKDNTSAVTAESLQPGERGPQVSGMPTTLDEPPMLNVVGDDKGTVLVWQNGTYSLWDSTGRASTTKVSNVGEPAEIAGPWRVTFPPNLGAPPEVTLDKLISWSEHSDNGVKYFSGTATYTRQINVPADATADGKRLYLDLGRVMVLAEVLVNGQSQGILWKAPYQVDITDAVHAGDNGLEIRATNLWPNRLIGDEQLPPENEYGIVGGPPGGGGLGTGAIRQMPDWYVQGQPKPTGGRITFTTWQHFKKDSPLLESGLIGPVRLRTAVRLAIEN